MPVMLNLARPSRVTGNAQVSGVLASLITKGCQTIKTRLVLGTRSTIRLDPTVYTAPGTYLLFDYSTATQGILGGSYSGQAMLDNLLDIDASLLTGLAIKTGETHGVLNAIKKQITVTLVATGA